MATGSNYQGGNDVVVTQFFQPILQTYQRNLAYQQQQKAEQIKQRDKVALEAQKDLSKLNANGLRQADLPAFNEAYHGVKNTFYKLNTTTDPNEQRRLSMELNNQLGQIEGLVYNSKEVAKWENNAISSLPSLIGKGKVDQARAHIAGATNKPSSQLSREYFDTSRFYNPYDISKVESAIGKLATQSLANADNIEVGSSRVGGYRTSGGKRMDTVLSSTSVKQPVIFEGLSSLAQRDPNVKAYVDDLMASDPTLDFNGAVALLGQQYGDRFTKSSTRDISADKASNGLGEGLKALAAAVAAEKTVQISTQPWSLGKFSTNDAITRNEKGVLLSGNQTFYDPETGKKIPTGRSQFSVDYTQDVKLPIDDKGNPLPEGSNKAVGTQNFSVAQVIDPQQSQIVASQQGIGGVFGKSVLIPSGSRQLFGKSKTVKSDAIAREDRTRSTSSKPQGLSGGSVR